MTSPRTQILTALADGEFHSGPALARICGISRAAVWKHIRAIETFGLRVEASRGRGYRLPFALELLDRERVIGGLGAAARAQLRQFELCWDTDSTNQRLLERARDTDISGQVCLAEYQSAGRGRRGRRWQAPLGTGLCLSVGWRLAVAPAALTPLGLAIGVAGVRALEQLGIRGAAVKWPNDLLWEERKLAGVLVEMQGEAGGPCTVVVGIGVNVNLPDALAGDFRQPWIDLARAAGAPVSRNAAASAFTGTLLELLGDVAARGGVTVPAAWPRYDLLRDRRVRVENGARIETGIARGVDADGALLVDLDRGRERFFSGDVSLSLVP